jgi:hypothetical protein
VGKWKNGRSRLVFNEEENKMKCTLCHKFYKDRTMDDRLLSKNTFILGCGSLKISAIEDHEKSKSHEKAVTSVMSKSRTVAEKMNSDYAVAEKMNSDYDDDDFDHECFDFQTESINLDKLMFYLRE